MFNGVNYVKKIDFEWQPQDGNKCYVCGGKAVLGYNSEGLFSLQCIECSDCKTAFYDNATEAINAYEDKVLY